MFVHKNRGSRGGYSISMASIIYMISGKIDPVNIRIRFKHAKVFDYQMKTGLKCYKGDWSKKNKEIRQKVVATYKDEVNQKLFDLRNFLQKEYLAENAKGNEITREWLKENLDKFFERPNSKDDMKEI